ncbi:EF-hand domain-containing protein [Arcobacter arenosus]|uniref:EF-hand domain-containing protein n=1 Tax=Arcobacter arenosus TaxID=2576037 RepID=UPI003BA97E20
MKTSKIILSALLVFGATFMFAETLPSFGPVAFSAYDTNKDGQISPAEFNAVKEKRMTQKAEQGRLMMNAKNSPSFSDVDTNGDGIISQNELQIHQQARFQNRVNQKNNMMNGQGMGQGMGKGMGQGMAPGKGRNW